MSEHEQDAGTATPVLLDRAVGVLLGTAAGDALGASYEFNPPLPPGQVARMGAGPTTIWEPGEWTDDTAMAIAIAEAAADGLGLRGDEARDRIVNRWFEWSRSTKDIGIQTSAVFAEARRAVPGEPVAATDVRDAATVMHRRTGRTAGNGSLMRTAPVALAYTNDPDGLTTAAFELSRITHHDPDAGFACVLWSHAIRHALLTGELDVRVGLDHLPAQARDRWLGLIETAEAARTTDFGNNGWVVHAFQEAWCGIVRTSGSGHLRSALELIAGSGGDTDTVAAIAGGLLGAAYGGSEIPPDWVEVLHGWPGLDGAGLADLARRVGVDV